MSMRVASNSITGSLQNMSGSEVNEADHRLLAHPKFKKCTEACDKKDKENFEGGGARRYFEPPAFLVPMAEPSDEVPKPSGPTTAARTVPAQTYRRPRAKGKPKNAEATDWLGDAPFAGEEVLKHLETTDNGGPGKSAVMYSHFWMLRRVQRGYACFDAYARIALAVAAQQMLLVCAYYSLGHFMSKMDKWPTRAQNPGAAWLSLAATVFASTTLFKLDLFCGWRYRYLMMLNLMLPPLLAGLAIHLGAARTNHGKGGIRPCDQAIPAWLPWLLAIAACTGHMCWNILIQRVAAPLVDGSSGLPLSFRSTIYLDVFGWHSRHFSAAAVVNAVDGAHHWENAEKMLYDAMDKQRPDNKYVVLAHQDAKRISKNLARVTQPEVACHLTREEQDDLQHLKLTVEDYIHELESQMSLPVREDLKSGAPCWFQCSSAPKPGTRGRGGFWLSTRFFRAAPLLHPMAGLVPLRNPALDAGEIEMNVRFLDPGLAMAVGPDRISTHSMGDSVRTLAQSAEWHGCGPPARLASLLLVCRNGEEPLTSRPAEVPVDFMPLPDRPQPSEDQLRKVHHHVESLVLKATDMLEGIGFNNRDALNEAETLFWSDIRDFTVADVQALKKRRVDRAASTVEQMTERD
ncbi:unnamed protein product [Cladocopium goreaui]|uniref:Uncharacterized protein n=1 Tax=Cladocopium goreaui TaxID=2562237 RepID=A0A9P1CC37_9DINO|nr:unnamed protein product [Cladocopium goreaui]